MTTDVTFWENLDVYSRDGDYCGELGDFMRGDDPDITNLILNDGGGISEWDYFVAADGEEYAPESPRGHVDWTGFVEAIAETQEHEL